MLYSRSEFESVCNQYREAMFLHTGLREKANELLIEADKRYWIHQTRWKGEPCLQTPEDLFAIQNIIYRTGIDCVIELGVAWGGTALYLSDLGVDVAGVDVYMPYDFIERIHLKDTKHNISLMNQDSLKCAHLFEDADNCMVILDSNHTHDHVLRELESYAPVADYLVVCDTIIEDMPVQAHRPRPWGPGNSPKTALDEFLSHHRDWEIDPDVNLLMSCNSYVRRK